MLHLARLVTKCLRLALQLTELVVVAWKCPTITEGIFTTTQVSEEDPFHEEEGVMSFVFCGIVHFAFRCRPEVERGPTAAAAAERTAAVRAVGRDRRGGRRHAARHPRRRRHRLQAPRQRKQETEVSARSRDHADWSVTVGLVLPASNSRAFPEKFSAVLFGSKQRHKDASSPVS